MSSLPQGWHGIPVPSKNSNTTAISGSSAPVTMVRKKWNSSVSSNIPQTKLPSYKALNFSMQNGNLNNTYQIKPSTGSSPTSQKKASSPAKPSPVKEYQNEIAKLKKELTTVKAENSILKAKVRRVDDENIQKGRQIEKMRNELKTLQKNESANLNRRGKESQELLMLRQKCSRLENSLRDKDLLVKKLKGELERKEQESTKNSAVKQRQIYQTSAGVLSKSTASKTSEKESITAHSSLSRTSLSLKSEISKLRDMIHKLEKENKDLQQQAKEYCQEIRRLKVQLKNKSILQTSSKSFSIDSTKSKITSTLNVAKNIGSTENKTIAHSVPKSKVEKNAKPLLHNTSTIKSNRLVTNLQKNVTQNVKSSSVSSEISKISSNKQVKKIPSKLPVTKPKSVGTIHKANDIKIEVNDKASSISEKTVELEYKIQEMRENIAAKKIQRSWRQHQKNMQHTTAPELQNREKSLTFIVSSLKHHKLRKDKLKFLVKKKSKISEILKKDSFIQAVETAQKKLWEDACSNS